MTTNAIPLPKSLPLAERDVLTIGEASLLGYGTTRTLYEMIRTGRLKESVLRLGSTGRSVRLLRAKLAEELNARG